LREARLRQAFRDLNDPIYAETPITQIAEHAGFRSAAHFSRAFTARFGVNPSTARGGTRSLRHGGHDPL
jgi:AraC-like DNA-binding protein